MAEQATPEDRPAFIIEPAKRKRKPEAEPDPAEREKKRRKEPDVMEEHRKNAAASRQSNFLGAGDTANAVLRMMSGMGFKAGGGMGKDEKGVSEALDVKVRNTKGGIGIMDEKTDQQKRWDREIRRKRGEDVSDDDEPMGDLLSAVQDNTINIPVELRQNLRRWRKRAHQKAEMVGGEVEPEPESQPKESNDIIDVAGNNFGSMEDAVREMQSRSESGPLKELRYNLRMLCDLSGDARHKVEAKLSVARAKLQQSTETLIRMEEREEEESQAREHGQQPRREVGEGDAMQTVQLGLEKVRAGIRSQRCDAELIMHMLGAMNRLRENAGEAWDRFRGGRLAAAVALESIRRASFEWKPVQAPTAFETPVNVMHDLFVRKATSEEIGQVHFRKLCEILFCRMQTEVRLGGKDDPTAVVTLFETYLGIFPESLHNSMIDEAERFALNCCKNVDPIAGVNSNFISGCASLLPNLQSFEAALLKDFFPRWLKSLLALVKDEQWAGEDVVDWYIRWKGDFPKSMLRNQQILLRFFWATDIMETGRQQEDPGQERKKEAPKLTGMAARISDMLGGNVGEERISVKDLLEEKANDLNYKFVPKNEATRDGHPQFSFGLEPEGMLTLHINREVIYFNDMPVAFEKLEDMVQAKVSKARRRTRR